jgi:hypothetical protein
MAKHILYRLQYRKKLSGNAKENSEKKNIFTEKYDEIRRFDGMYK